MKIYALWIPIIAQMSKDPEIKKGGGLHFFSPNLASEKLPAYCGRIEDPLRISMLAEIDCECGKKYTITVSSQKPLKKGDYIIAWHPDMDKDAFKNFARLSVVVGEKFNLDKVFGVFDAKVKFNNFTISGGCDCREMTGIEKLLGGKTRL